MSGVPIELPLVSCFVSPKRWLSTSGISLKASKKQNSMTPATSRERMQLELTRNVLEMPCQQHREAVCELARTLAEGERHRPERAPPVAARK